MPTNPQPSHSPLLRQELSTLHPTCQMLLLISCRDSKDHQTFLFCPLFSNPFYVGQHQVTSSGSSDVCGRRREVCQFWASI